MSDVVVGLEFASIGAMTGICTIVGFTSINLGVFDTLLEPSEVVGGSDVCSPCLMLGCNVMYGWLCELLMTLTLPYGKPLTAHGPGTLLSVLY